MNHFKITVLTSAVTGCVQIMVNRNAR